MLAALLLGSALGAAAQPVQAGPGVGATLPAFEAVDQHGRRQSFETLRGPQGLVLVFFRSADW